MPLPRSISYRRYAVSGRIPDPHSDEFVEAMERARFVPLPESGADGIAAEEEAVGWTGFDNFLDTQFVIPDAYDHGVLQLALRMDKRVVPAALVRAHLDLEKKALRAAGEERISRRQMDDLKQGVIEMLLPRTLPRTQVVKGLWDLRNKLLYLLSTAETPCERFAAYFSHAFEGQSLTPLEPTSLVGHLEATRSRIVHVDQLSTTDFRPGGGVRTLRARGAGGEDA